MRLANVDGRAVLLVTETTGHDVATSSADRYGPDPAAVLAQWDSFLPWAQGFDPTSEPIAFQRRQLGPPSPSPRQIIGIGLNYGDHAAESGLGVPVGPPPTFTKFVSSLAGPDCDVTLPAGGHTDWEVELVVVIGRVASLVDERDAWDHVAGLTVGQDLSERVTQLRGPAAQFSLGKSFANFAPTGPCLVTADELQTGTHDRDDLELGCSVDGQSMQHGRTGDLIFPVPRLITELTKILTLHPGDLIFTGTPAGVGLGRTPQRFLAAGEHLVSWIDGIGEIRQVFRDPAAEG